MTFRQAFYISIAAHIMVFGSAIAFAQFSGVLLSSSRDALMVALVSSSASSGSGNQPMSRRKLQAVPSVPPTPEMKKESVEELDTVRTASSQLTGHEQQDGRSGNDNGASNTVSTGGSQGTSDQIGTGTPGEWAVLAEAIEKTKSYPRLARERGIEGVVHLRFKLASSGAVDKIEILQSSGFEILDNASIGAVYRAAPLPYVSGWVEMPMKYVLK